MSPSVWWGVTYPSAACRICGQAIYDLAAYEDAQWWLRTHLIMCHHIEGLMIDLQSLEWMVRHGVHGLHDVPVDEQGFICSGVIEERL